MNRYTEAERDIVRAAARPEPPHIWTRVVVFNGHEIRQRYGFALCEARTRARAGLDDGMRGAA